MNLLFIFWLIPLLGFFFILVRAIQGPSNEEIKLMYQCGCRYNRQTRKYEEI